MVPIVMFRKLVPSSVVLMLPYFPGRSSKYLYEAVASAIS